MSTGEILYCFKGSVCRDSKRFICSSLETEKKYFIKMMPSFTSISSNMGTSFKKRLFCSSEQNPMTGSTMARLYQLRSKSTISPACGRCWTYRWKYHWVCSMSLGCSRATTLAPRGFMCCMTRLMVPPLPAASRPSKRINTRMP